MQNSDGSNGLFGGRAVPAPDGSSIRPETTGKRPVTAAGSDSVAAKPGIGEGSNAASGQQSQAQGSSGKTAKPGDDEARAAARAMMPRWTRRPSASWQSWTPIPR